MTTRKATKESSVSVKDVMKKVTYAQLGVYGMIYDKTSSQVSSTKKALPKKFDELVKRGDKVQGELKKFATGLGDKVKSYGKATA